MDRTGRPGGACRFVDALTRRCLTLARNPRRFPVIRRVGGTALRKLSWRGYLIFYRVGDGLVDVVHIVHCARDWAAFLSEDD